MNYLFYPGCALEASSPHYYKSCRLSCEKVGIQLDELEDWTCCGATAYVGTDEVKATAYSARNLALAERAGATDLVTACNACYITLRKSDKFFTNETMRHDASEALQAAGLAYDGTVRVRHIAEVLLNDVGPARIKESITTPLDGLKVACYHGCLLTRPFTDIGDPEQPDIMDRVLAPTGAEMVDFPATAKCCGGMLMTTRREVGLALVYEILSCARAMKADVVAVACPLCSVNLEAYQDAIGQVYDWDRPMPIVLFTQLLALAQGASAEDVGLDQCMIRPEFLMERFA
ncbi:MAG: disulfide reductase [candidate division WS1 bacterium]|jgi:heterodisulfide reductase subunit B|nr:disulfide reductase [candidate division WS1 bacterium]